MAADDQWQWLDGSKWNTAGGAIPPVPDRRSLSIGPNGGLAAEASSEQPVPVDQRTNCPVEKPGPTTDHAEPMTTGLCVISFQAHIVNASQVAPTSSNVVHWELSRG